MSYLTLIDRLSRERSFFQRDLKTEYVRGVIQGLSCAIAVIQTVKEEMNASRKLGRREVCGFCERPVPAHKNKKGN